MGAVRGGAVLPVPNARGPRPARGGRVAAIGARDRLSRHRDPLRRGRIRRCVRRRGRRFSRDRLYALVGRRHDGGARLDSARARRVRHVEAVARAGRCVPVRQRDARTIPGAGRRRRRAVATARDAAVPRDDPRARDHLARRHGDPAQRAGIARQAVSSRMNGVQCRPVALPPTPRRPRCFA